MKRIFFLALLSFTVLAPAAIAQRTAIKLNVLSPIVRTANFSVEEKLGAETSFQLGFFYTSYKHDGTGYSGFGVTPEFRYYLGQTEAIAGLYIAPFLRYNKINIEGTATTYDNNSGGLSTQHIEADLSSLGGGVVVGKQWVFKERITFDMFVGPRGMSRSMKVKSGTADDFKTSGFGGFGLRAGVTFGVAF